MDKLSIRQGKGIIGIDLDGVLGNLTDKLIYEANLRFNVVLKREQITRYKFEECTELTTEQVGQMLSSENVYGELEPIQTAREALNRLHSKGWKIFIITDRSIMVRDITEKWLRNQNFYWDELSLVKADQKANYALSRGIKVFVEDRFETVLNLSKICDLVYLIDQPYNQGKVPINVMRVKSWEEIILNIDQNF